MKKILLALLTTLIATAAVAQPHDAPPPREDQAATEQHHGKWGGQQREKLGQRLGLTPEQREKIAAVRGDRDEQEKNYLKLKLAKVDLKEMLKKDSASDDEILKRTEEISKMMVDQNMQKVRRILAIRKILTPEQRTKFREFIEERSFMDEHRDEHGGFGEGHGGEGHGEFHKHFFGDGDGK